MKEPPDDEATGLPGLRTWPRVYLAVLVILVVWIAALMALPRVFL
jgi:hypothetical protein